MKIQYLLFLTLLKVCTPSSTTEDSELTYKYFAVIKAQKINPQTSQPTKILLGLALEIHMFDKKPAESRIYDFIRAIKIYIWELPQSDVTVLNAEPNLTVEKLQTLMSNFNLSNVKFYLVVDPYLNSPTVPRPATDEYEKLSSVNFSQTLVYLADKVYNPSPNSENNFSFLWNQEVQSYLAQQRFVGLYLDFNILTRILDVSSVHSTDRVTVLDSSSQSLQNSNLNFVYSENKNEKRLKFKLKFIKSLKSYAHKKEDLFYLDKISLKNLRKSLLVEQTCGRIKKFEKQKLIFANLFKNLEKDFVRNFNLDNNTVQTEIAYERSLTQNMVQNFMEYPDYVLRQDSKYEQINNCIEEVSNSKNAGIKVIEFRNSPFAGPLNEEGVEVKINPILIFKRMDLKSDSGVVGFPKESNVEVVDVGNGDSKGVKTWVKVVGFTVLGVLVVGGAIVWGYIMWRKWEMNRKARFGTRASERGDYGVEMEEITKGIK